MQTHIKVLGAIHIIFGALAIFTGLGIMLLFGGIAGIVAMSESAAESAIAIPILGGIGGIIFISALVLSLPALIAGIGLINFRPWARVLMIVLCAIELINVPIGTILGIYGLWVLLSREGTAVFATPPLPSS